VAELDDKEIVDLFFERKEEALEETKLKYNYQMFHTSMNILRNTQEAEECVNDTLLKAWESIPPTRPQILGAFLMKIIRNLSINKWKAKGARRRGGNNVDLLLSELEECIPHSQIGRPEEEYEAKLVTAAINECLESMNQTTRVTFVLRYFHGESIRNISERCNMTESKVKSLLFRSRKKLKTHLEKKGILL
jgi:RNA polymerase sigma-70 factor (ECF subfamily)